MATHIVILIYFYIMLAYYMGYIALVYKGLVITDKYKLRKQQKYSKHR